jgi:hypothetical protein
MTMGGGKTFTACNFIPRLIPNAGARRVLFPTPLSILRSDPDFDPGSEETSVPHSPVSTKRPIEYNPAVPIEAFDFVVTDEYFDSFPIGLTASRHPMSGCQTPAK